jgi:hypothetical protein
VDGTYIPKKVINEVGARIGSIVIDNTGVSRLYFCRINPDKWIFDRSICWIDIDKPEEIHRTNVACIDNFYNQPYCVVANGEYVLFVGKVIKNREYCELHVYHSYDGVEFFQRYSNPLLAYGINGEENKKLANPTVVFDRDKFVILIEGAKNMGCPWYLYRYEWRGIGLPNRIINPVFDIPNSANPYIFKEGEKWYLFYGIFNEVKRKYDVYTKEYRSLNEII